MKKNGRKRSHEEARHDGSDNGNSKQLLSRNLTGEQETKSLTAPPGTR